jgi:hypothetical protein
MSYTTSIRTNLLQNQSDFEIDLKTQSIIFRKGYFIKKLDPIQDNPKEPRTPKEPGLNSRSGPDLLVWPGRN